VRIVAPRDSDEKRFATYHGMITAEGVPSQCTVNLLRFLCCLCVCVVYTSPARCAQKVSPFPLSLL
jgi:hypothetical protein